VNQRPFNPDAIGISGQAKGSLSGCESFSAGINPRSHKNRAKGEKRRLDPFGMLRASASAPNSDGGMSTAEGCRWEFADAPFVPQGRRDKLRSFR
jgi:hypothetical protein